MRSRPLVPVLVGLVLLGAACSSTAPTTATEGGSTSSSDPTAAPDNQPLGTTSTAAPATTAPDPGDLPQTDEQPADQSPALDERVEALWDGIVADDPEAAQPFFFPLGAYEQVKDISDPAADYENRLLTQYAGDIHTYHQQLGADADRAEFVSLDIPAYNTQWINPGVEYNQIGYWRVLDSTLRYEVDGVERSFNVKSMISWRGEWYVVHLIAIV